ncbi:hypothetical protein CPB84DRAFT_1622964, partial [Gymnopilus junonius]
MPLEATMLVIDNSEWMRNGDYVPTRFDAQSDAVNVTFQTKIDSNPENTVGIMTMAGKSPEVLVTHTKDLGQILGGIHTSASKIGGEIDIPTALAVAQLALKHRENKNLRQRIIVFVGSPPGDGEDRDEQAMIRLAKKLKKNNVAVDIIAFGDGIEGGEAPRSLKAFIENINSGDNSHLVTIAPGPHLLSDILIASPILSADRSASIPEALGGTGAGPSTATGGTNEFEFGVDPSLDPELAMALRMSMQEAQAREAAEAASSASSAPAPAPAAPSVDTTTTPAPATTTATVPSDPTDDEEERLLQEALALSQQTGEEDDDGDVEMDEEGEDDDEDDEEDEDAAIARAIEMSMQTQQEEEKK